ncbi:DUF1917-domain-containing protein [Patellaria atrata CBS 101060]|uniref:DUF1917-domain-containing protein n=1 Tax=Patellaria atrata CBS 101060 TaxID=1346257 RepID=A0A9P4S4I3_9PEZI|nr:DUF1917-domain-containing protein [Patellaria atrata CBS 101060]
MTVEGDMVSGDGWISDESSFCGDTEISTSKKLRRNLDIQEYWTRHPKLVNVIAHSAMSASRMVETEMWNPGEGEPDWRQVHETIPEFLERLPPLASTRDAVGSWIWIANPYPDRKRPDNADLAGLTEGGSRLLEAYTEMKEQVEKENAGRAKGIITRKLTPQRQQLKNEIYKLAKDKGWMLFPMAADVIRTWRAVSEAIINARLGPSAKIATIGPDRDPAGGRLICIYTKDFSDVDDVRRVLNELVLMGLVKADAPRGIYYKADALTHLGIESGNDYGLQASLYSSKDMLAAAKPGKKRPIEAVVENNEKDLKGKKPMTFATFTKSRPKC